MYKTTILLFYCIVTSDEKMDIFTHFVYGMMSQVSRSKVVAKANTELDSSVWRIRWKSLEDIFSEENSTYCSSSWVVNPIVRCSWIQFVSSELNCLLFVNSPALLCLKEGSLEVIISYIACNKSDLRLGGRCVFLKPLWFIQNMQSRLLVIFLKASRDYYL
jgi:hypothetical protein